MPQYSKTSWVDGTAPAISAANLNKLEQGVFDSIRQDGSTTMSAQLVTIAGSAATPAIAPTGDNNTGIFFPAADNLGLAVGGGEGFRLLANGNVGLSQGNPSVRLALGAVGGQKFNLYDDPSSGIGIGMGIDISGIGSYETTFYSKSNAGGNGQWTWGHLNSSNTFSEKMRLTSAGNVGIGTTSPTFFGSDWTTLQVENTTGGAILRTKSTNVTADFYVANAGATAIIRTVTNHPIQFNTNDTARLIIEAAGTTRPTANNTYDLGSATYRWATIYAQNALNTSDARLKTDVAPSSLGLDFINQLNPVQYRWIEGGNTVERVQTGTETVEITPAIPAQPEVLDEEGNVIQEAKEEVPAVTEERPVYKEVVTPREGVRTHFGLIAQEVKAALPDGLDFAGWCLADKDDAESTQSLGYTQLIAPMIKAIQELNAKVEALEAQLNK